MKKILVIDDQKDNLISVTATLKNFMPGIKVLTAQSGAEGIVTAKREELDTILLDIIMPEMDGYEVCKKLKEDKLTKHIPVILLTAIKTDSDSRIKGLKIGADAFLSKPIDPAELSAQVNVMLRIKEAEDKLRSEKVNLEELVEARTKDLSETNKNLQLEITERKRMEEAIKESEERFRGLSEAAFEAIFISEKGVCLEQNSTAEKMFGYTLSEAIGRKGTEWIVPEDREMVMNNMLSGYEEPYEATALRKDGSTFPAEIQGRMMHYKGRTVRVTALNDITERKQAEAELRESEERLSKAQEVAKIGSWEMDITTEESVWSDQTYRLFGLKPQEFKMTFEKFKDFLYPEDQETVLSEVGEAMANKDSYESVYRIVRRDNEVRFMHSVAEIKHDESGKPVLIHGTIQDITERKQTKDELIESEERFKSLMMQSPFVVELYDLNGLQISVNKSYEELWGFPAETTLNQFNVLKSKEVEITGLLEYVKRAYAGESVDVPEYVFDPTGDTEAKGVGRVRWLNTRIYPLKEKSGKVINIVIVHQDITKRKQAEEKLTSRNRELQTFYDAAVGRELKVIELKKEINEILENSGEKPKYETPV